MHPNLRSVKKDETRKNCRLSKLVPPPEQPTDQRAGQSPYKVLCPSHENEALDAACVRRCPLREESEVGRDAKNIGLYIIASLCNGDVNRGALETGEEGSVAQVVYVERSYEWTHCVILSSGDIDVRRVKGVG